MNTRIREWKCKWKSLRTYGRAGSGWRVGVGCCRKWVSRQVRQTGKDHQRRAAWKEARDLTAGFLFAKDRDFNYSACCVSAHSSEAKVGAQGSLRVTNLPLFPLCSLGVIHYCRHFLPSFLELGSWLLGYPAFSATDTSLGTINLQKMWFQLLIQKFLNIDPALAFFDISSKGE